MTTKHTPGPWKLSGANTVVSFGCGALALTDEQYAEVLATAKRRDVGVLAGYLHVSRWCDGSTACAVGSEPHGHWRGAYSVRSADVIVRLLDENERLTRIVEDYDRRFAMLAKIAQGVEEKVGRYLEYHGPSCDEHEDEPDEFCATCRMDTAANDAISELKFWSNTHDLPRSLGGRFPSFASRR